MLWLSTDLLFNWWNGMFSLIIVFVVSSERTYVRLVGLILLRFSVVIVVVVIIIIIL